MVVFTSLWLGLAWTTLTVGAYALVCLTVDSGFDVGAGHEKALIARLAAMYVLVLGLMLIIRFERVRRQAAVEGERQLQRERIELSQTIHDTTAQTAYMIDMGIRRIRKLTGESSEELVAALDATSDLSRSAMWDRCRASDTTSTPNSIISLVSIRKNVKRRRRNVPHSNRKGVSDLLFSSFQCLNVRP